MENRRNKTTVVQSELCFVSQKKKNKINKSNDDDDRKKLTETIDKLKQKQKNKET